MADAKLSIEDRIAAHPVAAATYRYVRAAESNPGYAIDPWAAERVAHAEVALLAAFAAEATDLDRAFDWLPAQFRPTRTPPYRGDVPASFTNPPREG